MKYSQASLFLFLTLGLFLFGCSGKSNDKPQTPSSETQTQGTVDGSVDPSGKVLVAYFSRTGEQNSVGVIEKGNTAIIAEAIAEKVKGELFEIRPTDDRYPMTYDALVDVGKEEQSKKARPEYAGAAPDLSEYKTVFIGAPVWWGDWPMIMYTFFEKEDLSGKTLIPFCTHEGSGLSGLDKKLAVACPNAKVLNGLAIRGADAQKKRDVATESVNEWLTGLGF